MLRTIFMSAWAGCNAALNAAAPDEHSTGMRNTGFQRLSKPVSGVTVQGGKTFCASFCASLTAGSRRAFLCADSADCVCLLLGF